MASVVLEGVNKYYEKNIHAVKDAILQIEDKEFVVLVGPSGCGKSTLLRMIAGLEEISSGEIKIGNRVVNNVSPKDRDIAMVFQNYALYPHMTVFENMAFGLRIRKFEQREIERRVKEAAELLDLTDYLQRKPKALSGGQRQRVAVGRAIVRKPEVFLFDEPLSNLDAKLRVQMRLEISRLHNRLGATMIYVTHDQVEAMTMGDRIVVMKDGSIQQVDTPLNIYNKPSNMFVAGFIGSPAMNFFEGRIANQNDEASVFKSGEIGFPLNKTQMISKSYHNKNIVMGIRPEHLHISKEPNNFKATVEVIEPMGLEMYIYLNDGNRQFTIRQSGMAGLKVGDSVFIEPDIENIHFFDIETENRG